MSLFCLLLTILHAFITTSNAAVVPVNNPVTLQLSRLVNERGIRNLVAYDQARAKVMREKGLGPQGTDSYFPNSFLHCHGWRWKPNHSLYVYLIATSR